MATFFDSPNSIIFIGLSLGFVSMTVGAIIACVLQLETCDFLCCKTKTNINLLEIEAERRRRAEMESSIRSGMKIDVIPESKV